MLDFALDNEIIVSDKLTGAIQEIDILFNTEQTELLGDYYFGSNFEAFMWDMTVDTTRIESYIYDLLNAYTYWLSQMPFDVNVSEINDESIDAAFLVEINLYSADGVKLKTIKNTI